MTNKEKRKRRRKEIKKRQKLERMGFYIYSSTFLETCRIVRAAMRCADRNKAAQQDMENWILSHVPLHYGKSIAEMV